MVKVKINDWDKFNPRTDSKNHTWFRFENTFFTKTFSWGSEEQRLFQYLCCVCSIEKKVDFKFDLELASALLKRKSAQIMADLKSLEAREIVTTSNIELLQVTESITQSSLVPTYVRTNDTYERTPVFDFEKVYEQYPKKLGKKKGLDSCHSQIKTKEDYDSLLTAVTRYADHCRKERTEAKFIKHFSTFMNSWTDWIDPHAGKIQLPKAQITNINYINSAPEILHPPTNPEVTKMLKKWRNPSEPDGAA